MPITADCHLHSNHSGDSKASMDEMIRSGIAQGLKTMCFTEHNDFEYPAAPDEPEDIFLLNPDSYLYELIQMREKYAGQIKILFGLELGLQPEVMRQNAVFSKNHEYDFIIGSSHICHGKDPYRKDFFEGRSEEAAHREYFESELENIRKFSNFDVYGHLDYAVRYGPNIDKEYSYEKHRDVLNAILELLLEKEKGLEINTGGLNKGMRDPHPCLDILKRYRELGGEIVTIGSDAHSPEHVARHFDRAAEALATCGFKYYTVFEKRIPEFIKL